MAKPISNIQDIVELTFFHTLRQECVSQGYTPDIKAYPNTTQGFQDYRSELKGIAESDKGFAIELFNSENPQDRGFKKAPRIVISSENFLEGSVGLDPSPIYKENPGDYSAITLPPLTTDFTILVRLVAETSKQMRLLTSILANALPNRGYIPAYLDNYPDEEPFDLFLEKVGYVDLPAPADAIIENAYRYIIPDLLEVDSVKQLPNAPRLEEITLGVTEDGTSVVELTLPKITPNTLKFRLDIPEEGGTLDIYLGYLDSPVQSLTLNMGDNTNHTYTLEDVTLLGLENPYPETKAFHIQHTYTKGVYYLDLIPPAGLTLFYTNGEDSPLVDIQHLPYALTALHLEGCNQLNHVNIDNLPVLGKVYVDSSAVLNMSLENLPILVDIFLPENNGLETLHLSNLPSLERLSLNNCGLLENLTIIEAPALSTIYWFNCLKLKNLLLSGTALVELDFYGFQDLISFTITDSPSIQALSLNGLANLASITITNCGSLKILNASGLVNLVNFTLNSCDDLEDLNLGAYPLPLLVVYSPSLRSLNLADSPLSTLRVSSLVVENLNVGGCTNLVRIPLSITVPSGKLKSIILDKVPIMTLPYFDGLPYLEEVSVMDCPGVSEVTIANCPNIKTVRVACQNLYSLIINRGMTTEGLNLALQTLLDYNNFTLPDALGVVDISSQAPPAAPDSAFKEAFATKFPSCFLITD